METKSIFKSKTFWLNVASAAFEILGVMPLPPGAALVAVNVGNIVLRYMTSKPLHIISAENE